jgi:hypothetical protein
MDRGFRGERLTAARWKWDTGFGPIGRSTVLLFFVDVQLLHANHILTH